MTAPPDPRFAVHPLLLTFADPAAERARWADFALEIRSYVRVSVVILLTLFSAFVLNDLVIFRGSLAPLVAIRFGVVVPCLAAALVVASTDRGMGWLRRWMQEYLLALGVVVCGGMLAMGWVLAPLANVTWIWVAGVTYLLMLTGVYGFSRLRFGYAVALGVTTTGLAFLLLFRTPQAPDLTFALLTFGSAMNLAGGWTTRTLELLGRREFAQRQLLGEARARSERLLRNALPAAVAERLRAAATATGERAVVADRHEAVTVVLADIVDFTPLCERLPAEAIAALLDSLYSRFDALCEAHGVEKIKTLGDAWLAAAFPSGEGAPARADHSVVAVQLALEMRAVAEQIGPALRIGVHTGPAVAGVIGRTRFAYDLWGDAVTGAAAMERGSRPGGIRVSSATAARLGAGFVVVDDGDGLWLMGERSAEASFVEGV